MNRRQFLFTSFASVSSLVIPNFVTAAFKNHSGPRIPLIVHTVVIRPHSNHFDTEVILKEKKSNGKHYLIHQELHDEYLMKGSNGSIALVLVTTTNDSFLEEDRLILNAKIMKNSSYATNHRDC